MHPDATDYATDFFLSHVTDFFTLSHVARTAKISRETLRGWLGANVVEAPRQRCVGNACKLPLFTRAEAARIVETAQARRERRATLRLAAK